MLRTALIEDFGWAESTEILKRDVRVDASTSGTFRYSGGGYVVQVLREDATRIPFASLARELALQRLWASGSSSLTEGADSATSAAPTGSRPPSRSRRATVRAQWSCPI